MSSQVGCHHPSDTMRAKNELTTDRRFLLLFTKNCVLYYGIVDPTYQRYRELATDLCATTIGKQDESSDCLIHWDCIKI